MYLQAIRMMGFKSFGQNVSMPFPNGITVIVGPNGGGKSNVVDAVRWALGEQRMRLLRAERPEDLLHRSAQHKSGSRMAEVTLEFNNEDGFLPQWPGRLRVSRRYYPAGDSEYLINGTVVRLKDVADLFLDSGIGRVAYAIIGQGQVEQSILMKPGERLEQVEEAAGISRYKSRRKETLGHLAEVSANLQRLEDLLASLAEQCQAVEPQAIVEEQAIRLEKEQEDLKEKLQVTEFYIAQRQQQERMRRRQDWMHELSHHEQILQSLEHTVKELAVKIRQDDIALDAHQKEEQRHAHLMHQAEERIAREQGRLDALQSEKDRWLRRSQTFKEQWARLKEDTIETDGSIQEDASGAAVKSRWQHAEDERKNEHDVLDVLQRRYADATWRQAVLQKQMTWFQGVLGVTSEAQWETALKEFSQRRDSLIGQEKNLQNTLQEIGQHRQEIADQEHRVKEKIRQLERDGAYLQAQEKAAQDAQKSGMPYPVKAVMQAHQIQKLRGIVGTISQLITYEERLMPAIQTALGGSAHHIVVHRAEDARYAVDFLQAARAGRATFLPLDALRSRSDASDRLPHGGKGFQGWALELVSFEDSVKVAIEHALGRTAVFDRLDHAVEWERLQNYRFKAVTLDGQLIHAGGAITGGSSTGNTLKKGPSAAQMAQQIKKIRQELAEMIREAKELEQHKEKLLEQWQTIRAQWSEAQAERRRYQEISEQIRHFDADPVQWINQYRQGEAEIAQLTEDIDRQQQIVDKHAAICAEW
ncbi:MAG: chromosome segregation SMC family protein, partial [Firmicutes bacterium]|nr:chromosome segregation SMC family protein [Bacillota bacterium]